MGEKKSNQCCCTTVVQVIAFTIVGVILMVAGGVLIPKFKKFINNTIKDEVKLKNGSQSYYLWHKPTSPIYMSYYVFDLNNRDDVMAGGKPNVTQKGPYVYRELRRNDPIHWSDNGNQLTYLQYKWYYFDPELSCLTCTPDDEIMTVNIPAMALANFTKSIKGTTGFTIRIALQLIMNSQVPPITLFHKLKVREILWGYTDDLLNSIKSWEGSIFVEFLVKLLNLNLADINPFIQLQYNGTNNANMTGTLSIYTGIDDVKKVQETYSWKGQRIMTNWQNPNGTTYGNMINGSDGTHFQPFLKSDDVLYVFIPDICRSLYLVYDSALTVKDIDLQRFTTSDLLFMNASSNKANLPFCVPKCFKTGLLPVGQCLPLNPPVIMSAPHFYQGDPSLVDEIIGLHPDKDKHATFVSVEPLTGLTMKSYKRLQANLLVEEIPEIEITKGVRNMIYPIMYIDESAVISDADASKFRDQVYTRITIVKLIQYGLIGLGVIFVIVALFIGMRRKKRNRSMSATSIERSGLIQSNDNQLLDPTRGD